MAMMQMNLYVRRRRILAVSTAQLVHQISYRARFGYVITFFIVRESFLDCPIQVGLTPTKFPFDLVALGKYKKFCQRRVGTNTGKTQTTSLAVIVVGVGLLVLSHGRQQPQPLQRNLSTKSF